MQLTSCTRARLAKTPGPKADRATRAKRRVAATFIAIEADGRDVAARNRFQDKNEGIIMPNGVGYRCFYNRQLGLKDGPGQLHTVSCSLV